MNLKSLKSIQHPHDINVFQSALLLLGTDPKSFISTIFGEVCRLQDLGLTTLGVSEVTWNFPFAPKSGEIWNIFPQKKKTNPQKSHLKKQHKKIHLKNPFAILSSKKVVMLRSNCNQLQPTKPVHHGPLAAESTLCVVHGWHDAP